jgi:hypothetical protein
MAHLDVRVLKDMEHTNTGGADAESCHHQRLRIDSMQFMPRDELEAKAWSAAGEFPLLHRENYPVAHAEEM